MTYAPRVWVFFSSEWSGQFPSWHDRPRPKQLEKTGRSRNRAHPLSVQCQSLCDAVAHLLCRAYTSILRLVYSGLSLCAHWDCVNRSGCCLFSLGHSYRVISWHILWHCDLRSKAALDFRRLYAYLFGIVWNIYILAFCSIFMSEYTNGITNGDIEVYWDAAT